MKDTVQNKKFLSAGTCISFSPNTMNLIKDFLSDWNKAFVNWFWFMVYGI